MNSNEDSTRVFSKKKPKLDQKTKVLQLLYEDKSLLLAKQNLTRNRKPNSRTYEAKKPIPPREFLKGCKNPSLLTLKKPEVEFKPIYLSQKEKDFMKRRYSMFIQENQSTIEFHQRDERLVKNPTKNSEVNRGIPAKKEQNTSDIYALGKPASKLSTAESTSTSLGERDFEAATTLLNNLSQGPLEFILFFDCCSISPSDGAV